VKTKQHNNLHANLQVNSWIRCLYLIANRLRLKRWIGFCMQYFERERERDPSFSNGPLVGIWRLPLRINGLGLYDKDLSRRDSMKVAQYEVLG